MIWQANMHYLGLNYVIVLSSFITNLLFSVPKTLLSKISES